jgi:hypothetical protein
MANHTNKADYLGGRINAARLIIAAGRSRAREGEVLMKTTLPSQWALFAACALFALVSGCAGSSIDWPGTRPTAPALSTSGQVLPNVQQDCSTIDVGSPTKYICKNGKVYTSHQLQEMRETGKLAKK